MLGTLHSLGFCAAARLQENVFSPGQFRSPPVCPDSLQSCGLCHWLQTTTVRSVNGLPATLLHVKTCVGQCCLHGPRAPRAQPPPGPERPGPCPLPRLDQALSTLGHPGVSLTLTERSRHCYHDSAASTGDGAGSRVLVFVGKAPQDAGTASPATGAQGGWRAASAPTRQHCRGASRTRRSLVHCDRTCTSGVKLHF